MSAGRAGGGWGGGGGGATPAARAAAMLRGARRMEIASRRTVDGLVAGSHRSAFRGRGVEFADLREYRPGDDDVRAIDWNVTARLGSPYVREFAEDRETRVYIVLDVSGSLSFGSGAAPKAAKAAEVAASLLVAAVRSNDAAGGVSTAAVPARTKSGIGGFAQHLSHAASADASVLSDRWLLRGAAGVSPVP